MTVLLDFQDHAIRLTDERKRHIADFADPDVGLEVIRDTLARPDLMTEAFHHPELRLYYRIYTRRSQSGRNFHVVVKVRGYDMLVVTAFYSKGLFTGGKRWKD
jgi:hypothetical protein